LGALKVLSADKQDIQAHRICGFVEEGRQRKHLWLGGRYVDNVLMGVLREEWMGPLRT